MKESNFRFTKATLFYKSGWLIGKDNCVNLNEISLSPK